MNSIKRRGILEKLYGTLTKYWVLKSSSLVPKQRDTGVDNLFQTRIRNFVMKNGEENNRDSVSRRNGPFCQSHSSRYTQLLASIENFLSKQRPDKNVISLRTIDDECCKLLGVLSAEEIFNLLDLVIRTGCDIVTLKLYQSSLLALRKYLERNCLDKGAILQLLFFQGLAKKRARKHIKCVLERLPPFQDLSFMEKVVVAYTSVKCSVKLQSRDARLLEKELEMNADELVKDEAILSTICKALRYAGLSDEFCLDNLDRAILENQNMFCLIGTVHILAMYAASNQQRSNVTLKLFNDFMLQIVESRKKLINVRIKDVDRFVWASSILNLVLNETEKQELSLFVERRYRDFRQEPHCLINTLLALWMLDCRLYQVIDQCLRQRVFQLVKKEEWLWKRLARLNLLLVCIKIDWPERSLPRELSEFTKIELQVFRPMEKLCRLIEQLDDQLGIREIKIDCPVEGIYIAGVSFAKEEISFHVDLLDEKTCFKGTENPHGLGRLKLRLLGKIGYRSILIAKDKSTDADYVSSVIRKSIEGNPAIETGRENFESSEKL